VSGPAIVADGLSRSFGDVDALKGVSFEVPQGGILGLLGPNGAGKTTAVRILTTLLRSDAGHASVLGVDVAEDPERVRGIIGLAGQYAALDENLTANENLMLVGRLTHLPRPQIVTRREELLARFELADAADRIVRTFSGGMRRRLDLACALVHRPPVLFLDEPTTGLDPQGRSDLWEVIERLVDGGTTVLLTTQYLEEADRLAHQIVVVDHGSVIAEGTAAQLKSRLGATVIAVGFDDPGSLASAAEHLAGVGTVTRDDREVRVSVTDSARAMVAAVRALDAAGLEPSTLVVREPTLDDVFLSLTGHGAEPPANGHGNGNGRSRRKRGAR
jgi:ABC-2 type transport system ATP-binding protein